MSLFVDIKVIPSAGRQKFAMDKSGILKCYLKNQPEKGKANDELIKFLAKVLSISKNIITITAGLTSRKKRIKLELDLDFESFLKKLGLK